MKLSECIGKRVLIERGMSIYEVVPVEVSPSGYVLFRWRDGGTEWAPKDWAVVDVLGEAP